MLKRMKKIILSTLFILVSANIALAHIASGKTGGITWVITEDGVFRMSGGGQYARLPDGGNTMVSVSSTG